MGVQLSEASARGERDPRFGEALGTLDGHILGAFNRSSQNLAFDLC